MINERTTDHLVKEYEGWEDEVIQILQVRAMFVCAPAEV